MKNLFLVSGILMIASCTTLKQLNNEEILNPKVCETVDVTSGMLMVKVAIDGNEQRFMFDSGAPISTINDTLIINDFYKKEISSLGSIKGVDKANKIKKQKITVSYKSTLFESDHKIVSLLPMPKSKCAQSPLKGIIGLDCFFNNDYPLFLNFSDGKMCNIDAAEMRSRLAVKGYRQVKSQCRLNSIYVYLTLGGKEHKFVFDTGYMGQLMVPSDSKIDLDIYNKMELEGSLFVAATSVTQGLETLYEKVPVVLAGQSFLSKPVVSQTVKVKLLGIQFIKGFDWIIDYKNNKVYAKRNHIKIEDTFNRKVSYYAKADEKLTVAVKEKKQTQYQLGDEIVSVNGQKATPENNCELQNLLNRTDDWSTLNLEVVPVAK